MTRPLTPLPLAERYEANAIIERLTDSSATFDPSDAERLITIIEATASSPLRLSLFGHWTSRGPKGHAAGLGDVGLDDESKKVEKHFGEPPTYAVGGYRVMHSPGSLQITMMWDDSEVDSTGRRCLLRYDPSTKSPISLDVAVQRTLTLLIFSFSFVSFQPWKLPRHEGIAARPAA